MVMEYLTQLIDKTVVDPDGERFGKLAEVIVSPADPLPVVAAYQIKTEDGAVFVPWNMLRIGHDARAFQLLRPYAKIHPYKIEEHDFSLVRDVLDKQIVDVHDYRVVRVNDIRLQELSDGRLALLGVDPGVRGLLRRLGLENAVSGLSRMLHFKQSPEQFIGWNDVESLPTHNAGEPLKLKVSHEKLAKLHPADIGDILNQLAPADRREVLESLDIETAAEALAEADDDVQADIIKQLDQEHAADILEEMPADEAADVLGDIDKARREDLLGRMDANDRDNVEELLEYGDETAGGLMTNEYVAIQQDFTAQQTIDKLRELEPEAETIYYVYVVDHDEHLVGVISLRDLIVAKPDQPVSEFMIRGVKSIHVDARIHDVAHKFERYKLLAIPVVDEDNELQGIITIDDTLEKMLPPDWRRRPYKSKRQPVGAEA
jgi:CBS domain-containing protein